MLESLAMKEKALRLIYCTYCFVCEWNRYRGILSIQTTTPECSVPSFLLSSCRFGSRGLFVLLADLLLQPSLLGVFQSDHGNLLQTRALSGSLCER